MTDVTKAQENQGAEQQTKCKQSSNHSKKQME